MAKVQNKDGKIYFKVGDIADMLGVNESLIRFWNKEFDQILNPVRNKRGVRFFNKTDVETYEKIFHLVKERGYTLPGALEVLKNTTVVTDENFEVIKTLKTIKQFLIELKEEI
jgi:DNA-binding transcriptional MerR regulator